MKLKTGKEIVYYFHASYNILAVISISYLPSARVPGPRERRARASGGTWLASGWINYIQYFKNQSYLYPPFLISARKAPLMYCISQDEIISSILYEKSNNNRIYQHFKGKDQRPVQFLKDQSPLFSPLQVSPKSVNLFIAIPTFIINHTLSLTTANKQCNMRNNNNEG